MQSNAREPLENISGTVIMTAKSAPLPDELLSLVAEKFHMLSDATRLVILRCLMDGGELNVSEIVARSGRGLANVSKHLKLLADARLITRRKEGSFVLYKLDDPILQKICSLVCDSLRRELEVEMKRNKGLLKGRSGRTPHPRQLNVASLRRGRATGKDRSRDR